MNDRYDTVTVTRAAASKVRADGNISEAQYKQMTDGTVSKQDITNAEQALKKATDKMYDASYKAASGYPGAQQEFRQAQQDYSEAHKLSQAVKSQYASQGYLETFKENAKDAVWGS